MWRKKQANKKNKQKAVSPQQLLLRRQILTGLLLTFFIGMLLTGVWYGSRIESLQIKNTEVIGGFTIPHRIVIEAAEAELEGTYLKLVPKRFVYLYPKQSIIEKVAGINRVKAVKLERKGQTLHIAFDEYQPRALWCESLDSNNCWFVDKNGLAFASAPELTGGSFVRFITDVTPERNAVVGNSNFITEADTFIEALENDLNLFVTHVTRVDDLDIEYQVAGGGRIKVSQSISNSVTINNLKSILTAPEFAHLEPGQFNYIDLRFGDKVFVSEEDPTLTEDLKEKEPFSNGSTTASQ